MNQPAENDAVMGGQHGDHFTRAVLGGFYAVQRKLKEGKNLEEEDIEKAIAHKCRDLDELRVKIIALQQKHQSLGLEIGWLTQEEEKLTLQCGARKSFYLNVELLQNPGCMRSLKILRKLRNFNFSRYSKEDVAAKEVTKYLKEIEPFTEEEAFNHLKVKPFWREANFPSQGVIQEYDDKFTVTELAKLAIKHNFPFKFLRRYETYLYDLMRVEQAGLTEIGVKDLTPVDALMLATFSHLRTRDLFIFDAYKLVAPTSSLWSNWVDPYVSYFLWRSVKEQSKVRAYAIALYYARTHSLKDLEQKLGIWNLHKAEENLAQQVSLLFTALKAVIDLMITDINSGKSPFFLPAHLSFVKELELFKSQLG